MNCLDSKIYARDRLRGRSEESNAFSFLLPRAPFVLLTHPKSPFSFLWNAKKEWGKKKGAKKWNKIECFYS